jgi:hypothetical protein
MCNEIGKSQGISIVLHKDDGGQSDNNESHSPKAKSKRKIALKKKRKIAHIHISMLPPAYLTNEGLFICVHEFNIFQKRATTDLSTCRPFMLGSICASAQ